MRFSQFSQEILFENFRSVPPLEKILATAMLEWTVRQWTLWFLGPLMNAPTNQWWWTQNYSIQRLLTQNILNLNKREISNYGMPMFIHRHMDEALWLETYTYCDVGPECYVNKGIGSLKSLACENQKDVYFSNRLWKIGLDYRTNPRTQQAWQKNESVSKW